MMSPQYSGHHSGLLGREISFLGVGIGSVSGTGSLVLEACKIVCLSISNREAREEGRREGLWNQPRCLIALPPPKLGAGRIDI